MLSFCFEIDDALAGHFGFACSGVRRAHLHPLLEDGDVSRRHLRLGGHFDVGVFVLDRFDEQALTGITGHDGWAGVAAFEPALFSIEQQMALDGFGLCGVTGIAVSHEHRTDLLLEEVELRRRQVISGNSGCCQGQERTGRKRQGDCLETTGRLEDRSNHGMLHT